MARRPSKHLRPARPLGLGHSTAADKRDGRWVVRSVPGDRALKVYRCPGCQQAISAGTAHVVAWPGGPSLLGGAGADDRRHWHTGCWQRRP